MTRWYDYYKRLSPLFESLQFIEDDDLEDIAYGVMKLSKQYNNSEVFDAIIENLNKDRPHRRWYDKNEHASVIYYSLEDADDEFIEIVTNFLDEKIPQKAKLLGEEMSLLYRQID